MIELTLLQTKTGMTEVKCTPETSPAKSKDITNDDTNSNSPKKLKKRLKKSSLSEDDLVALKESPKPHKRRRNASASDGPLQESSEDKQHRPQAEENDSGVEVKDDSDSDAEVQVPINGLC